MAGHNIDMIQQFATWGTLAGTIATAIATIFLWRVTRILAVETKRMADAAAQPQIVANIVPNQWSVIHLDISVENTGNATAFDIEVTFDPPLQNGEARGEKFEIPFQRISVLKPGQSLQSYLADVGDYLSKTFQVTISWKNHPSSKKRDTLIYTLNMSDYSNVSYLGGRDPVVQIAEQIKKLREDWRYVASGSRRIKTETFDTADRKTERDILDKRFGRNQDRDQSEADDQ